MASRETWLLAWEQARRKCIARRMKPLTTSVYTFSKLIEGGFLSWRVGLHPDRAQEKAKEETMSHPGWIPERR